MKLKVVNKADGESNNERRTSGNMAPFHQDKPMCETLLDLQLTEEEKKLLHSSLGILLSFISIFLHSQLLIILF